MKFNKLYTLLNEANVNSLIPMIQREYIEMQADNTEQHNRMFFKNNKIPRTYNDLTDEQKESLNNLIVNEKKLYSKTVNEITTNPQYQSWIYELLSIRSIKFDEDIPKTKELLEKFDKVKKSENFKNSKNILDYKTFEGLHKVVTEFINLNRSSATLNLGNNKIIHTEGEYKILELTNFKDAEHLLKDTGWCVQREAMWDRYEPPYYLILKNNKQYALAHFESKQLKNVHDGLFNIEDVDNEFTNIINWLINFKNIIITDLINSDFESIIFNQLNYDYQKVVALHHYKYLKYMKNPDREFIKYLIKDYNGYPITVIDDPDCELQVLAVKFNSSGNIIKFIKNPCRETIEASLKISAYNLQYINNPSRDILKIALENDGKAIKYIKNPDKELQLLAVREGYTIKYINDPDRDVKLAAVRNWGTAIQYIPEYERDKEIEQEAIKSNSRAIEFINNPSKELQLLAVSKNGSVLNLIRNPDKDVQLAAVKNDGTSIDYIYNPDKEVQLAAVNQDPRAIKYIRSPDKEVQLAAVRKDYISLYSIRDPDKDVIAAAEESKPTD